MTYSRYKNGKKVTLTYDVMVHLLEMKPNNEMFADELEKLNKELDIWVRPKDGQYPETWQIERRASKHPELFDVTKINNRYLIRLK